jgi:hypothetical protein
VILRNGTYALPFGAIDIALNESSGKWGRGRLSDFLPATRMRVSGLANVHRSAGLGAPLAVSTPAPPKVADGELEEARRGVRVPIGFAYRERPY